MAERIILGQFDIDSRSLEDKIAQNQTKIDLLKGEITETRKSLKEYQDQAKLAAGIISEGNKALEEASRELQEGIITQEQYNYVVDMTSEIIRESEIELARLIETEREQQRQLVRYQTDLRSVNDENRELNNLMRAGRTEVQGNEGAYRELSQQLGLARTEANNLGAQMLVLEQNGQRNTEEYIRLNRQWHEATQTARELHDGLLELDRATGDNRRNVGNYTESIREAFGGLGSSFAQLMSGNVTGAFNTFKESIGGIKTAVMQLWTAILTNPLLALAAGLAAIGVGFVQGMKAVYEYNVEVSKLNKEIEQLTNLTGPIVDKLREFATATEKVFGKDFKDGIQELNSLMTDFKLTSDEAFKIYQDGLVKGGAANSEFGESIREYGVLFAQNGYSAQEFLDLLNAGIDLDVYSDKLPDAIKEAGLALNEQTKATRDALVNAFGQTFSDDLLKGVRNASVTVKQAVDQISIQAQKVGLNTQQIAQLNADVFKGAGEDAGGLVKIIEAVNLANSKEIKTLTEGQKATLELADANVELEKAKTEAFKSDLVSGFTKGIELSWVKIKTVLVQLAGGLVDIVLWFDKLTGTSDLAKEVFDELVKYGNIMIDALEPLKGLFNDLLNAIGINTEKTGGWIKTIMQTLNPLNLIKGAIILLSTVVKGFGTIIENSRVLITTFALTAKSLFNQVISVAQDLKNLDFSSALNKLKTFSITNELKNARKEAEKIVALNKQKPTKEEIVYRDDTKIKKNGKDTGASADAAAKAAADRQKLLDKQQKEAEKARLKAEKAAEAAAKQDLANAKERANIAIQATQSELAEYIAMNAEKLKSDKRLTQARVNQIQKYLDDVREKMLQANQQEREQKLLSLDEQLAAIKGNSQQELDQKKNLEAQKQVVRKEYDTKEIQIVNDVYEKRKELDKNYETQKTESKNLARALEYQKQIADLESQHASELVLQKVNLDQQTEQKLASFLQENELKRQLNQENYDINSEIEAQRKELENQIGLEQDEIKKQNLKNLLSALNVIQAEYANKDVEIARNKEMAKYALAAGIAQGMAQIAGEQSAFGKSLAVAETTITTYMSATKAFNSLSGIPIVGPTLGAVAAGLAVASGLANVAKITGINIPSGASSGLMSLSNGVVAYGQAKATPKAADGVLIGPSHSNGGIPINTPSGMIEAEGGEVIINKRSSAMYRDVLSRINQLGGGVKFASGGVVGNISSLPTVQNNFKSLIDMDMMREVIGEAVLEGALLGTQSGSQMGLVELSNNREIQNGANF
ncbi:hypothetical protein [Chryseobacterium sp. MYb328]|uniref:hypothetical protein n=1 Tax=Chryseobacterium sp. MYb328 TaxID=2745231 RepID=UPI0030A3DE3C